MSRSWMPSIYYYGGGGVNMKKVPALFGLQVATAIPLSALCVWALAAVASCDRSATFHLEALNFPLPQYAGYGNGAPKSLLIAALALDMHVPTIDYAGTDLT